MLGPPPAANPKSAFNWGDLATSTVDRVAEAKVSDAELSGSEKELRCPTAGRPEV